MSRRSQAAAALAVALLVAALLFHARGHKGGPGAMVASWALTPGVVNPDVTQATIRTTICVPGFSRSIRPPSDYTTRLKVEQMRRRGLPGSPSDYQEDHLISLEMGGHPTDPRNLWPEPYPRAAQVDRLENELHAKICSGAMSLSDARLEESRVKHTKG